MNTPHPKSHLRQQGMVTIIAVIFLITAVIFALSQTLSITGSNSIDNKRQIDSTQAFFLAESGLERAQGILNAAVLSESYTDTTCANDIGSIGHDFHVSTGSTPSSFRYTTLAPSSDIHGRNDDLQCTKWCDIQVVGTARGATRTLNLTVCAPAPGGGARGCGGSGEPGECLYLGDGVVKADWNKDIVQTIKVSSPPVILLSNMAYLRHPDGGVNANADRCVALSLSGITPVPADCIGITQWNDESNHSTGNPVVGSRGASTLISLAKQPGEQLVRYDLTQNLDVDSLFAAVSARFTQASGGTLAVTGSYWNDSSSPGTVSNNATPSGQTNNGAACPPDSLSTTCPNATPPPITLQKSGSLQASRSWCYGADTLVFGFSGRSSNKESGVLTSFRFGTAPESKEVPDGTVAYPVVRAFNTQLYSTLRTIYNRDYLSAPLGAVSSSVNFTGTIGTTATGSMGTTTSAGATATGVIGASFKGDITTVSSVGRLTVGTMNDGVLTLNGVISCISNNCPMGSPAPHITGQLSLGTGEAIGGKGRYTLSNASSSVSNKNMLSTGTTLTLSGVSGSFARGNSIFINGVNSGTTISDFGTGTGGNGTYILSGLLPFVSGATITTPSSIVTTSSNVLTVTAVTSGAFSVGNVISGTGVVGSPTIQSFGSGTGGAGTYNLSSLQNFSSTTITAPSALLTITAIPGGSIAVNDVITGAGVTVGTSITSLGTGIGGTGTYNVSGVSQYAPPNTAMATSIGATVVRVPVGTPLPAVGTLITRRTLDGGSGGQFPGGTIVLTVPTAYSFTVNNAPSAALSGATICGGICAFFNHSSAAATTDFTIKITGTQQWAAGMTCLKGVDPSNIVGLVGTGGGAKPTAWHEVVR